jgi:hypothetical protein
MSLENNPVIILPMPHGQAAECVPGFVLMFLFLPGIAKYNTTGSIGKHFLGNQPWSSQK